MFITTSVRLRKREPGGVALVAHTYRQSRWGQGGEAQQEELDLISSGLS